MVRLITSFILFFCTVQLIAQQYLAQDGEISFFSNAPLEDIRAAHNKVNAVYEKGTQNLVFRLNIKDFIFPNPLMQEHFNENYLESDIYPTSIFVGKIIEKGNNNATVEGDLTIHGETKEIKVDGIFNKERDNITISATFIVQLEDYNIKIPKIVMYKIAEEIEIKVNVELKAIE